MTKLIYSDKLLLQLEKDIENIGKEFVIASNEYRELKKEQPLFFNNTVYWNKLLDNLVKLAQTEQKLETLDYVMTLIRTGDYDSND